LELQKKPAKATLHSSTRTKEKITKREKKQHDARKPLYGQSLINPKYYSSLGTQMFLLNKWYLKVTNNDEAAWLVARVRPEHYLGYNVVHIEFNELHQLLKRDALDKSLIGCWCL
jgi:hypothetical protein